MKAISALLLLIASLLVASSAGDVRERELDDIREAVFRLQIDGSDLIKFLKIAYYLRVDEQGNDPTDEFMKRFARHDPPVRKGSECTTGGGQGVRDKRTGAKGVLLDVTTIERVSDTEAHVEGGEYRGYLSGHRCTYTVKKTNGKWAVVKATLDIIF
ncbi:MAG: hypothetical protein JSS27_11080 [Planctomycetes bacterium]|nr:hypothetical protein [Planctomycetota bacterium]